MTPTTRRSWPSRTPWNPWDPEVQRLPGGSSSGSAVAVAAGLAPAALGSDTGGSVRIPAAFCGLVGLKPTFGRISTAGVLPLDTTLDSVGPLTHTVQDAALLLHVLAGPDPRDPGTVRQPPLPPLDDLDAELSGLRLCFPREFFWEDVDPAVEAAVQESAQVFADLHLHVEEVSLPVLDGSPGIYSARYAGEGVSDKDNLYKLIDAVKAKGLKRTPAYYTAAIAIVSKYGEYVVHGWMHGDVIDEARGEKGFGYDPMFIPDGCEKTLGELDDDVKSGISHRGQALELAKPIIQMLRRSEELRSKK